MNALFGERGPFPRIINANKIWHLSPLFATRLKNPPVDLVHTDGATHPEQRLHFWLEFDGMDDQYIDPGCQKRNYATSVTVAGFQMG